MELKKVKVILSALGIFIFSANIVLASNFNAVNINSNKTYAETASGWSNNSSATDKKSYAEVAADWSDNDSVKNSKSYGEITSGWSNNGYKIKGKNYVEIAADWSRL